jgi:phage protein D
MTLEILSPATSNFYAPRFEVEINNSRLAANISKAIIEVTIDEKMDEGANFRFTVNDEFDMAKQQFKWLDHPLFDVGNTVSVKLGYGRDLQDMVMGTISGLEPSFFSGDLPTIVVTGQDLSYDYMKRPTPERTFTDRSYSDIARAIAAEAKLQAVVDDTAQFELFIRKNNNETYYSFLESLAAKAGFTFSVDRRTMYFIKPKDDRKEILILALGKDIVSFSPRMNTTDLVTEVEVRGHNPQDPGTPIVGRAQSGSERSQETGKRTGSQVLADSHGAVKRVITGRIVNSVEHANSIAQAELNRRSDTFIEGDVDSLGIPQIRPGVTVKLDKMGAKFSGKYYVTETSHSIGNNGYRLHFKVKRNAL